MILLIGEMEWSVKNWILFHSRKSDFSAAINDSKGGEQPKDNADHDHSIENAFDFPIHRDVVVDEPKQYPNDNQGNQDGD
jgi:hypothetical protein